MIRDTSAQDRRVAPKATAEALIWIGIGRRRRRRVARLHADGRAPDVGGFVGEQARLRIAEVKRGTLTRDVSVQGRVVAAVSPTLYARSAGTVALDVHAGDKVKKGDVLAEIDSPELTNKLKQEQATLDSLGLEVERADIDNRKQQLASKKASSRRGSIARPPSAKSSATRRRSRPARSRK